VQAGRPKKDRCAKPRANSANALAYLPQLLNVLLGHISIIELDGRWRSF